MFHNEYAFLLESEPSRQGYENKGKENAAAQYAVFRLG